MEDKTHHDETLDPPHKMQVERDPSDESPWDGDKFLFDERCYGCKADLARARRERERT